MSLFSDRDREQVRHQLDGLPRPVRLRLFTQTLGCDSCRDASRMLHELTTLTARVSVVESNLVLEPETAAAFGIDHTPAIAVLALDEDGCEHDHGLRFVGVPSGYELASLVDAIQLVSSGQSRLSESSRALLARLSEPVTIRVFVTPTCSYCPRAVGLAHRMALESPLVTSVAVEVSEYPDLIQRYRVNGVPKIVANDRNELLGAHPEELFVAALLKGLTVEPA